MTLDDMIAVLQAAKAGKQIQFRKVGVPTWKDIDDPSFDFLRTEYRVKPEPREWWLCNGKDHNNWILVESWHDNVKCGGEKVRVREVLE